MKINAGCGRKVLDGWYNIDLAIHPKAPRPPELLCDVRSIPLPDGCADELMAIHLFEHVPVWDVDAMLKEWRRLLRNGGRLTLEMPDIVKAARNLLAGLPDQQTMWAIYGDPGPRDPLNGHRWGWTFKTLKPVLELNGFTGVIERPTQFHPAGQKHRDFRVEATAA